jgi:hypothetical protein
MPAQAPSSDRGAAANRSPGNAAPAGEQSASMRPRSESNPEPADLFRPPSEQVKHGRADRTALVPTVPPPAPLKRPASTGAGGEAGTNRQGANPGRPERPNEPGNPPANGDDHASKSTSASRSG